MNELQIGCHDGREAFNAVSRTMSADRVLVVCQEDKDMQSIHGGVRNKFRHIGFDAIDIRLP